MLYPSFSTSSLLPDSSAISHNAPDVDRSWPFSTKTTLIQCSIYNIIGSICTGFTIVLRCILLWKKTSQKEYFKRDTVLLRPKARAKHEETLQAHQLALILLQSCHELCMIDCYGHVRMSRQPSCSAT